MNTYHRFLTNLSAGDSVTVYSTKDGSSFSATVKTAAAGGFTLSDESNFNADGNGRYQAKGTKLAPVTVDLPQGFALSHHELEELVG